MAVLVRLRQAGFEAYFAGGCVRDELLGVKPKDYDVATSARPEEVRKLFRQTQAVGAAFGVILVRQGRSVVEVATFRTDDRYLDGRHPEAVHFTDAQHDAQRRDFTINGLFLDPLENRVIDFVGGQEDLKKKIIRAIGEPNHRFEEDHLRLLRAVRFAARLGYEIEPATAGAISKHAEHLKRISPERVAEELRLTLTPPTRLRAWEMIVRYGLDEVIFRMLKAPMAAHGVQCNRSWSIFSRLAKGESIPFGLALAAAALEHLAHRIERLDQLLTTVTVRQVAKGLRQSLKISNDEMEMIEGTLYGLEILTDASHLGIATMKRFLARPTASLSRQLLAALPEILVDDGRRELEARLHELEETDYAPAPLITGDDLTALGMTPGPAFRRILDAVYDAQLEDRVKNKQEAMELARKM